MSSTASAGGLLVVMSAPSGAGKGTLRRALISRRSDIVFCPSVTTRNPRPGEVEGVDYRFVSVPEFHRMVQDGELIEWATVYDNLYGTPGKAIVELLNAGRTVIVEKDVQGAATLRNVFPDAVYVFVLPPSFEELKRRVEQRGTETCGQVCRRLQSYERELQCIRDYQYVIVNDDITKALAQLEAIIIAEGSRVSRCLDALVSEAQGG